MTRIECQTCQGTGDVDTGGFYAWGASINTFCPRCDGTGSILGCHACGGIGSPPGEAAGLVCGACMGSGIESTEEID